MNSECPACGSHAFRVATDIGRRPWGAVVYGCLYCGLYWVHGDYVWIEEQYAENLAELLGQPRTVGVSLSLRMRIDELTRHSGTTGR
jgi:hypothetical protein